MDQFVRTPAKPPAAPWLTHWGCQCEKLSDRSHVLGHGHCRRLRRSEVDQRCQASSCRQAEGSSKGSLPIKDSEYLPLIRMASPPGSESTCLAMPRWVDEYKKPRRSGQTQAQVSDTPRQLGAVLQASISMLATDEAFLLRPECLPRSRFELVGNTPAL